MKRKSIFLPVALLVACPAIGRQSSDETTSPSSPSESPVISSPDINGVVLEPESPRLPVFKVEKIGEKPVPSDDRDSRAWNTTAGWRPGLSAFPDAVTHESQLSLLAVPAWLKQLKSRGD